MFLIVLIFGHWDIRTLTASPALTRSNPPYPLLPALTRFTRFTTLTDLTLPPPFNRHDSTRGYAGGRIVTAGPNRGG